jgi:ElaB/YqjD/DUF883 family membrane-anchored ribosome-binding protein
MTAPRGIRNNNPGNIRYVEGTTSLYEGCTGSDGAFCTFDTAHHGIRALCKLLLVYQDKHGLRTVRGCINRWAPPVENDTGAYVDVVAHALNVDPDDEIDLHRDFVLAGMALAIIQHENGQQPYAPGDVMSSAREALGFAYVEPAIVEMPPDTQAPAPIEERPQPAPEQPAKESFMPIPAIILGLIQAAASVLPVIAQIKGDKTQSSATQNVAIAGRVLDVVATTVGAVNQQQAVEIVQQDQAARQKADEALRAQFFDLLKFAQEQEALAWDRSEKSVSDARSFAERMLGKEGWQAIGYGALIGFLAVLIIGGSGWIFSNVLFSPKDLFDVSTKSGIIETMKTIAIFVVGFFFGSSASSRQSGEALRNIAQGKGQ